LGFCSGVPPVIESLKSLCDLPRTLILLSAKYRQGTGIPAKKILEVVKNNPAQLRSVAEVLAGYSPSVLAAALIEELLDYARLELYLSSAVSSRAYGYETSLPRGLKTVFCYGDNDEKAIAESTLDFIRKKGSGNHSVHELKDAGHHFIVSHAGELAGLIRAAAPLGVDSARSLR
jgi:hypothetical protein